ncbi:MAG TPA: NAD-dependent epimerase/dehydratase family protein [Solirubrobacterales bacterium]|nr:NAD-dependent epimerase/dehydratase family protein [Solirubrobacterales bacterium]
MKVLVTGGAGFIGSNLVDALIERGDDVVVLDNLTTGRRVNVEPALSRGAKLVVEDIRDADLVTDLLAEEKPEVVFHLAAQIDVRVSTARPAFDAEINVMGTINMLEAARQAGTRRFVYASTGGAIYGETDVVPTPEDTIIAPEAPYGQAKFAGEGYLGLWHRMHDLSTVSMRFGNVYGPRQDPLGEAGVIAIFCGKLETGGQPTVFGDGRQTRDYIFVEDVVRACMIAGDSDATGSYNVGRGEEVSVLDLVEALRALGVELGELSGGNTFEAQFAPARLGEVQRSALDPTLSRETLGFTAEVELMDGLRRTLQFVAAEQAAA